MRKSFWIFLLFSTAVSASIIVTPLRNLPPLAFKYIANSHSITEAFNIEINVDVSNIIENGIMLGNKARDLKKKCFCDTHCRQTMEDIIIRLEGDGATLKTILSTGNGSKRSKRSWNALGNFFSWFDGRPTHDQHIELVDNVVKTDKNLRKVLMTVENQRNLVANLSTIVQNATAQSLGDLTDLQDRTSNLTHDVMIDEILLDARIASDKIHHHVHNIVSLITQKALLTDEDEIISILSAKLEEIRSMLGPDELLPYDNIFTWVQKSALAVTVKDGIISSKLSLPIVSKSEYEIFRILHNPIFINDKIMLIEKDENYIHVSNNNIMVSGDLSMCTDTNNFRVCNRGNQCLYKVGAKNNNCIINSFAKKIIDPRNCQKAVLSATIDELTIVNNGENEMFIIDNNKESEIAWKCSDNTKGYTVIKEPARIEVYKKCELAINNALNVYFIKQTNITFDHHIKNVDINIRDNSEEIEMWQQKVEVSRQLKKRAMQSIDALTNEIKNSDMPALDNLFWKVANNKAGSYSLLFIVALLVFVLFVWFIQRAVDVWDHVQNVRGEEKR